MVEVIGVMTMTALIWVLAFMMATESDSERRRAPSGLDTDRLSVDILQTQGSSRHAA